MHFSFNFLLKHHHSSHFSRTRVERLSKPRASGLEYTRLNMQEELASLQLLEREYCHMSSHTYSQHQATNRNHDKQAFKQAGKKKINADKTQR